MWNDSLHVLYRSMVHGYHKYQSIWDNPLEDGDLLCEWETGNLHDPQAVVIKKVIDGMVGTLQVVGHVATKENISNLFNISAFTILDSFCWYRFT